jgi:hypothetical protein
MFEPVLWLILRVFCLLLSSAAVPHFPIFTIYAPFPAFHKRTFLTHLSKVPIFISKQQLFVQFLVNVHEYLH